MGVDSPEVSPIQVFKKGHFEKKRGAFSLTGFAKLTYLRVEGMMHGE